MNSAGAGRRVHVELTRSRLRIVVSGRPVTAEGEALLPGHGGPDFVLYARSLVSWDDGRALTGTDRLEILSAIATEAQARGLSIEVEEA